MVNRLSLEDPLQLVVRSSLKSTPSLVHPQQEVCCDQLAMSASGKHACRS